MPRDPGIILKNLYKANKLGPLYIIRPPIITQGDTTENPCVWINDFFKEVIAFNRGINLTEAEELEKMGVSDLYHIIKNPEHKEYKVDEESVLEFVKAHSYPPLEYPYKIIAVHEAETLSDKIANKWLKTLEEPLEKVVTLFLTNSNKALLQTIESRAITLRLPPGKKITHELPQSGEDFPSYLDRMLDGETSLSRVVTDAQKKSLKKYIQNPARTHFFLDALKGGRSLQNALYDLFNSYAQENIKSPRMADNWLKELNWFEEAQAYNNQAQERFLGLLQLVQSLP